ncbi:MAG: hypothetical protein IJ371_00765, partial [Clostridia bacterium]|nr:hypothetical protein [Clostridia bacterium]
MSEGSQKGLIEKTILPTIADDNYAVSIVSGSSIATIGGSTITFNGVGKVELRFVSLFDRTKTDTVTIFVENPLHEDVFTINASSGLEDRNQNGERFTTQVGVNSIISVDIKDVDGQTFDSAKTYMTATVGEGKAVVEGKEESIANLSEYFTLTAITEEIVKGSGKYVLGQFNVSAIKLDTKHSYMEIPVTIKVYLNLENYYIGDTSLSTLMDNASILLEERTITIVVYNKATGLTISSDVKAEAGEDIDVVAKLTTGYVDIDDKNASGNARGQVIGEKGEKLVLNTIVNHDKVEVTLTPINENAIGLLEKAKQNGSGAVSVWDLFDRYISYELFKDASGNSIGYTYSVNLRLLDEYRYLDLEGYTEREWKFKVTITASSNTSLSQSVEISFVPQSLIGLRLENYSNLVATAGEINGTTEANEFVSNQAESSLIIPGSSGLIKIFADYEYSYFEDISITSSRELIDGKEYFIRYQQLVYNKNKEVYESYAGITADGETLNLKKVSYI